MPVIPALDGFRAYAILGIVFFHLVVNNGVIPDGTAREAFYGAFPTLIEVLFVLSGFVVFLPTVARAGEFGSVRAYAIRRAARLVPAYWLSLVVVLAMLALWPTGDAEMPTLGSVAIHGAFGQIPATLFNLDFLVGFGIDSPVWTLSLEVAFYVILPFVATAYCRRPFVGLALAAAITVGWRLATENLAGIADLVGTQPSHESLELTRLAADRQIPGFAAGMTAAWLYVHLRRRYPEGLVAARAGWVQLGSLAALVICGYAYGHAVVNSATPPDRDPILSIAFPLAIAAFMLSTTLVVRARQFPFAHPTSRALGDISYGIYLIHFPLMLYVVALLPALVDGIGAFWTSVVVAVPLTVAYGWASARFLEQPIRRWAHKFGRSTGP